MALLSRVYFALPSARPPEEAVPVLRQWQERGYRVVIQRDNADDLAKWRTLEPLGLLPEFKFAMYARPYTGYAEAVNFLCREIIKFDPQAEWIVIGGDDTLPDPNHSAEEIGLLCKRHFLYLDTAAAATMPADAGWLDDYFLDPSSTFGVMQPTGDREFGDAQGPYIDRVAGSPWIGREFARRMYGGRGPLCEAYYHCGEDEELQAVATMLGVFWQRQDLIHRHNHWGRPKEGQRMAINPSVPEFLERANSPAEWAKYKAIIAERKAAGWPGHEPIL